MENGIVLLNKMKDMQQSMLMLKKISNEIHEETTIKAKEISYYEKQNDSQMSLLRERKQVCTESEIKHQILNTNLEMWETMLKSKIERLKTEEKELKQLEKDLFSSRIDYCNAVYDFLNTHGCWIVEASNETTEETDSKKLESQNSELCDLEIEVNNLENELEILENNNSSQVVDNLEYEEEIQNEELRLEKMLENKERQLNYLTHKIETLKAFRTTQINSLKKFHKNESLCIKNVNSWIITKVKDVNLMKTLHSVPLLSSGDKSIYQKFTPKEPQLSKLPSLK